MLTLRCDTYHVQIPRHNVIQSIWQYPALLCIELPVNPHKNGNKTKGKKKKKLYARMDCVLQVFRALCQPLSSGDLSCVTGVPCIVSASVVW